MNYEHIRREDAEIFAAMEQELTRQRDHIELIASENFTSPAVMEAVGSHLTNKYAEGYPGKRFYGGCEYVDIVEDICRNRAKELFGLSMPTCSRTPAPRRTSPSISPWRSPGTCSWVWTSPAAATSPTAPGPP